MRPARLRGRSRKLSDLYIDLRVPRATRARARVVERADGTIVWAEHVGAAHGCIVRVLTDPAGGT
ncbi:MAG: tRNA lysidine(34) synthetase TilS [Kofleriaceae bacterium]|nr:MAG: tRNA lysidine(34) synthetase TilS [Kofleriaceae bacterium]